jgi:hypothetical protein
MLNILSIRCGLAFAPYLADAMSGYLDRGAFNSRVVKQGGNGLILRSDTEMDLRYQAHEAALGSAEARHYSATLALRRDVYDIARMADEIVFASVGDSVLLSHIQSELWLEAIVIQSLVRAFREGAQAADLTLPDWLTISTGANRLLLSDQRTGRWVLLGAEHAAELERRAGLLASADKRTRPAKPPTLTIKGVTVHLQSAFKLAATLERFVETGDVTAYTEQSPDCVLTIEKATEGLAIRDFDQRAALNAREARKYAAIVRDELEQRRAVQFERGSLRTVVADDGDGRWLLQWGDEVFLSNEAAAALRQAPATLTAGDLVVRRDDGFLLLLNPATGACVALTDEEESVLTRSEK